MADVPRGPVRFLAELKRRHVFRVALAYLAAAFVLLQATDLIVTSISLPRPVLTIVFVAAVLGFPLALALSWAFDLSPEGLIRTPDMEETVPARHAEPVSDSESWLERKAQLQKSVAVLPFVNLAADTESQYFSDGMTEDIIASVSRLHGLRVISRTSAMAYRNTQKNVREIGRELGVATVLEGSVRRAGDRVRIVAQLVDARTDSQLWSEVYDRQLDDIFAIQSDVAERIANALEAELTPDERATLEWRPTRNMRAYDLYLNARHAWNRRTEEGFAEAVRYLTRAIELDEGFALAHAGMADAYVALGIYGARPPDDVMPLAQASADRAIALNESLGEAWTARACVRSIYRWEWADAERDFLRAIELSPQYPTARQWYAINHLAPRGRIADARASLNQAASLDPLSSVIQVSNAFLFYLERRYDEAAAECRAITARHPEFAMAHFFLGLTCEALNRHDEAIDALSRASTLRGGNPEITIELGRAYVLAGQHTRGQELLESLLKTAERVYISPARIALFNLALGREDAALNWLERAVTVHAVDLVWIGVHPHYDPIRNQPRFVNLLRAVGLAPLIPETVNETEQRA